MANTSTGSLFRKFWFMSFLVEVPSKQRTNRRMGTWGNGRVQWLCQAASHTWKCYVDHTCIKQAHRRWVRSFPIFDYYLPGGLNRVHCNQNSSGMNIWHFTSPTRPPRLKSTKFIESIWTLNLHNVQWESKPFYIGVGWSLYPYIYIC